VILYTSNIHTIHVFVIYYFIKCHKWCAKKNYWTFWKILQIEYECWKNRNHSTGSILVYGYYSFIVVKRIIKPIYFFALNLKSKLYLQLIFYENLGLMIHCSFFSMIILIHCPQFPHNLFIQHLVNFFFVINYWDDCKVFVNVY